LEQTLVDVPAHDGWLSPAELRALTRFTVPHRRADWRLGRWTAKKAITAFAFAPAIALPDLSILAAPDGAPAAVFEAFPAQAAPALSLSHRQGRCLCVVDLPGTPVGCDLEAAEPRSAAFVADYFTAAEQRLVQEHPALAWLPSLIWSAKESVLKAVREGLRLDPRCVQITLTSVSAGVDWQPWRGQMDGVDFAGWWRGSGGLLRTVTGAEPPRAL
jgi:4'-phosphopantetheinyl transferase